MFLIENSKATRKEILDEIKKTCKKILNKKREDVEGKLESVRKAYEEKIVPKLS